MWADAQQCWLLWKHQRRDSICFLFSRPTNLFQVPRSGTLLPLRRSYVCAHARVAEPLCWLLTNLATHSSLLEKHGLTTQRFMPALLPVLRVHAGNVSVAAAAACAASNVSCSKDGWCVWESLNDLETLVAALRLCCAGGVGASTVAAGGSAGATAAGAAGAGASVAPSRSRPHLEAVNALCEIISKGMGARKVGEWLQHAMASAPAAAGGDGRGKGKAKVEDEDEDEDSSVNASSMRVIEAALLRPLLDAYAAVALAPPTTVSGDNPRPLARVLCEVATAVLQLMNRHLGSTGQALVALHDEMVGGKDAAAWSSDERDTALLAVPVWREFVQVAVRILHVANLCFTGTADSSAVAPSASASVAPSASDIEVLPRDWGRVFIELTMVASLEVLKECAELDGGVLRADVAALAAAPVVTNLRCMTALASGEPTAARIMCLLPPLTTIAALTDDNRDKARALHLERCGAANAIADVLKLAQVEVVAGNRSWPSVVKSACEAIAPCCCYHAGPQLACLRAGVLLPAVI